MLLEFAVIAVLFAGVILWAHNIGAIWRGEKSPDVGPSHARTLPLSGVGCAALLLAFVGLRLEWTALFVASSLLLMVVFALTATVVLFNRPKTLVPPHLRDQPGAVAEWLRPFVSRRRGPRVRVRASEVVYSEGGTRELTFALEDEWGLVSFPDADEWAVSAPTWASARRDEIRAFLADELPRRGCALAIDRRPIPETR